MKGVDRYFQMQAAVFSSSHFQTLCTFRRSRISDTGMLLKTKSCFPPGVALFFLASKKES